jgi:hypothetical protein
VRDAPAASLSLSTFSARESRRPSARRQPRPQFAFRHEFPGRDERKRLVTTPNRFWVMGKDPVLKLIVFVASLLGLQSKANHRD